MKRVKHDKQLLVCAASFTPFNSIKIHVHHTVTNVFLVQVSTFSSPNYYVTARRCSLGRFDISELQLLLAKPLKKSQKKKKSAAVIPLFLFTTTRVHVFLLLLLLPVPLCRCVFQVLCSVGRRCDWQVSAAVSSP